MSTTTTVTEPLLLEDTPLEEIPKIHLKLVATFRSNKTLPLEFRLDQIRKLYYGILDNKATLLDAVYQDFHKPPQETFIAELSMALNECVDFVDNLTSWAKPKQLSTSLTWKAMRPSVRYNPMGTVLIVVPFNYPLQLALVPLIGALAAGNTVLLKLSELTPHTSSALARLVRTHLDNSVVDVALGALPQSRAVTQLKYDLVFFTGSGRVGAMVAEEAGKRLTPVVLELGGKSPTFVLDEHNLPLVAKRIVYGRFINGGQTCIAPDYLLVKRGIEKKLVPEIKKQLAVLFGEVISKDTNDYAHLVSDGAYKRIKTLIDETKGEVVIGGTKTADAESRFIEPTVVLDPPVDDTTMVDEIFGPVLPIILIDSVEQGIDYVRDNHSHPLALYVFSQDRAEIEKIHQQVSAGSGMVNGTLIHVGDSSVPFGGVGQSGIGAYHGKNSFETFSHKYAFMTEPFWTEFATAIRYPPYSWKRISLFEKGMTKTAAFPREGPIPTTFVGRIIFRLGYVKTLLLLTSPVFIGYLLRLVRGRRSLFRGSKAKL